MRIRRYAARLLSSTSSSPTSAAPSSPPPAATWLHAADDDCCAFCELSRPATQEGQDAVKHKGHIAGRVPESDVRADARVGLPQRPPAPEAKKCKIDHVPRANKASVGLHAVKRASSEDSGAAVKPEGATPVSEAAAASAAKAGAFVVNDAAIEQGVKCVASVPSGALKSKLENTAENSLANGSTTGLEAFKGASVANELVDVPVSETAASPAALASASVVNNATTGQGVKRIASLPVPGGASKLEATAGNSLVNGSTTGLEAFKGASVANELVDVPVSETAAGPAALASASVVNNAATGQGVKRIASLPVPGGASKLEATAGNSLVDGSTTELEVFKGASLANELADVPGVTSIMQEVTGKPVTDPEVITTMVDASGTGSVVHETTGLESAGEDYIASEAATKPEAAGRASCNVHDTAALDEPQLPSCDPSIGNVKDGNAIDIVASTMQPSQCDVAEGGGSVNSTTNGPVLARGPTVERGVPKDKSIAPSVLRVLDVVTRSIGTSGRTDVICYARRTSKRKLDLMEVKTENIDLEDVVICEKEETLVRTDHCESVLSTAESIDVKLADIKKGLMDNSAASKVKKMKRDRFECSIDYCHMSFKTKAELAVHKRNMCTVNSCSKRFRSHSYLRRHQSAHNDDMPYKCPWDGCNMAFKWSWDRAEHFKVHAGAKPYKCTTPGCIRIFKFVSDFTRHRRRCKPQR